MPNVTLATVLKSREDLLVELAAEKGLAIDGLRRRLETLPGRTHLRTVADSLVPNKPQDDAYASYIAWLSAVAGKLRLNNIGELDERLAEFTNRKAIGNIEETATLSYPTKVAGEESRDPWQEIRVGTVKAVLHPASDFVTRARTIYDRPHEDVLRYIEKKARAFRRRVTKAPLIEPSTEVIAVAMSTNAEHVHTKTLTWPVTEGDTVGSNARPRPSSAVGDSRQSSDRRRAAASRRSGIRGSTSWRDVIDSISETVRSSRNTPVLIAINAPLGWPVKMIDALAKHEAGNGLPSLDTDADDYGSEIELSLGDRHMEHATRWREERNRFFRRETERIVRKARGRQTAPGTFGPAGLDVGADKSARTAHAALRLLKAVRRRTGLEIPVITDRCGPITQTSAIEVYTGLPRTPPQDAKATPSIDEQGQRQREAIGPAAKKTTSDRSRLNADRAAHTAIAFLECRVRCPHDHDVDSATARREGWIWF